MAPESMPQFACCFCSPTHDQASSSHFVHRLHPRLMIRRCKARGLCMHTHNVRVVSGFSVPSGCLLVTRSSLRKYTGHGHDIFRVRVRVTCVVRAFRQPSSCSVQCVCSSTPCHPRELFSRAMTCVLEKSVITAGNSRHSAVL